MKIRLVRGSVYALVSLLLASGAAHAAIPAGERQALLDIYTSTGGAGWTTRTNWTGPAGTECTWYGITCNGAQTTVTRVSLGGNNLIGPLPVTIANLVGLQTLYLNSNQLAGAIPSFGSNTALQILYLNSNQLTGDIPSFASNTALQILWLFSNQLTGAIPSFASNTALQYLALNNNLVTGDIPSFASNTALQYLWLGNTLLTGAIPSFASNTALQGLGLENNQLSGAIPSFASNSALRYLYLHGSQLSGTIPSFASNTALQYLYLHDNQLSGAIPSFASNTALRSLYLHNNQLSGPIPSFASNTVLQELDLHDNQLSGAIPSFASNTALMTLYLNSNQLIGSVHPSLGTLTSLLSPGGLDLRWNALFSTDAALIGFLNSKQIGGNWQSTQTIPVTGLGVSGILPTQVTVNWTPITYTGDSGHYQVFSSTIPGGPYSPFGTVTANKSATSLAVTGLTPLTPYFFVVQTATAPHANNQNTVLSGYGAEVASATTPVELLRFEIE